MNRFSQANPMHSGQSNPSSNSSHIVILPTPTVTESTATPFTTNTHQNDLMDTLNRLKFFLATAPSHWVDAPVNDPDRTPRFNSFLLPNGESVSCVYWNGIFHITGTDIVRVLLFRFEAFGRPVRNFKKFEEGVFSDLRNLKPGIHATLEEAKSQFLDVLFKHRCIRTHKKQKVFYWFTVDHDHLFLDALERDLKREKVGQVGFSQ
ncbi:STE like transcription factor-domain-containing protein [Cantharellus anzutake]|uniref:STE like transcription factor-domain-containing protein n=1 Tax=Cantharellus anzutake TaxID=1750568 RepID=UPI00190521FA|nr:STE like transcription factor-domain-containing protein [Cantharellus anzutake]KAF8332018.1 STE like transcription factor-domain-containing protein [Cantharellus anzutake]